MLRETLRRPSLATIGAVAVFLLLPARTSAQKVTTKVGANFDFSNYKRFAWKENHIVTRQGRQNDELIEKEIIKNVNRNSRIDAR